MRGRLAGLLSTGRVVIVGVGNRDRDDAFGPKVLDRLKGRVCRPLVDAGMRPENFAHRVAACRPHVVLFVDAAELGEEPGRLALRRVEELAGGGISCHAGGVALMASYLAAVTGAACHALLAQRSRVNDSRPDEADSAATDPSPMSPPVWRAVDEACRIVLDALSANNASCVSRA
ncbi:MAG TPA: hydrogenase maturation protease [Phycisphaerae bacterium]|nr:hydrogenase maturation protease [Phycisphaerae bacterium]